MPLLLREVSVFFWLRTSVLSTLAGWLVALVLVYVGERGWLPQPPAALLPMPKQAQPQGTTPSPREDVSGEDGASFAERPASRPDDEAALPRTHRLVVAEPDGANLRAEPTTAGAIITALPRGTLVEAAPSGPQADAPSPGWQHVVWNGRAGWVWASLLRPAEAGP
jgi:hypothetical protein